MTNFLKSWKRRLAEINLHSTHEVKSNLLKMFWDGRERSLITGADPGFMGPEVHIIWCSLLKENTKLERNPYK